MTAGQIVIIPVPLALLDNLTMAQWLLVGSGMP